LDKTNENEIVESSVPTETEETPQDQTPNKKGGVGKWIWTGVAALILVALIAWCAYCAVKGNGIGDVLGVKTIVALLFGIFLVAGLGYLLGSIKIKGISLGTAGVFLVAIGSRLSVHNQGYGKHSYPQHVLHQGFQVHAVYVLR